MEIDGRQLPARCWVREEGVWVETEALGAEAGMLRLSFIHSPWRPHRWVPAPGAPADENEPLSVRFDEPPPEESSARVPHVAPHAYTRNAWTSSPIGHCMVAPTFRIRNGAHVVIIKPGTYNRQHGIVESSSHGYHMVRTASGGTVHARARELLPVRSLFKHRAEELCNSVFSSTEDVCGGPSRGDLRLLGEFSSAASAYESSHETIETNTSRGSISPQAAKRGNIMSSETAGTSLLWEPKLPEASGAALSQQLRASWPSCLPHPSPMDMLQDFTEYESYRPTSRPVPGLMVGRPVVVSKPGLSGAQGVVTRTANGFWSVRLLHDGATINLRSKELEVLGDMQPAETDDGAGGAGGLMTAFPLSSTPSVTNEGGNDSSARPAAKRYRTVAARLGLVVGAEVEILRVGKMEGRRGFVVRLCNGYAVVHVADGVDGDVLQIYARSWEVRVLSDDYVGCWCDTMRHLPTTDTPFEGVWVQCDKCGRWCHGECAGLDRSAAEAAESFICVPCTTESSGRAPAKEGVSSRGQCAHIQSGSPEDVEPSPKRNSHHCVDVARCGFAKRSPSRRHSANEEGCRTGRRIDAHNRRPRRGRDTPGEAPSPSGPRRKRQSIDDSNHADERKKCRLSIEEKDAIHPESHAVRDGGMREAAAISASSIIRLPYGRSDRVDACLRTRGAKAAVKATEGDGGALVPSQSCASENLVGMGPTVSMALAVAPGTTKSIVTIVEDSPLSEKPHAPLPTIPCTPLLAQPPDPPSPVDVACSACGGREPGWVPSDPRGVACALCHRWLHRVCAGLEPQRGGAVAGAARGTHSACGGGGSACADQAKPFPPFVCAQCLVRLPTTAITGSVCGSRCVHPDASQLCCNLESFEGWLQRVRGKESTQPPESCSSSNMQEAIGTAAGGTSGLIAKASGAFAGREGEGPLLAPRQQEKTSPSANSLLHAALNMFSSSCHVCGTLALLRRRQLEDGVNKSSCSMAYTPTPDESAHSDACSVALADTSIPKIADAAAAEGGAGSAAGNTMHVEEGLPMSEDSAMEGSGSCFCLTEPLGQVSGASAGIPPTPDILRIPAPKGVEPCEALDARGADLSAPTRAVPIVLPESAYTQPDGNEVCEGGAEADQGEGVDVAALECISCGGRVHLRCVAGGSTLGCDGGGRSDERYICSECESFLSLTRKKGEAAAESAVLMAAARAARRARRQALALGESTSNVFEATPVNWPAAQKLATTGTTVISAIVDTARDVAPLAHERAATTTCHLGQQIRVTTDGAVTVNEVDVSERSVHACAYAASAYTARRLRRALAFQRSQAGAAAESSRCRHVLERGSYELFYAVFTFLDDAWTLRAASCVCSAWNSLLDRAAADGAAKIWSAATLTAPRGPGWSSLRATRPGDKVNFVAGIHPSALELPHPLEITGSAELGTVLSGHIVLRGAATAGRVGVLRHLRFSHFYNPAVTLHGGSWRFEDCVIDSSRRNARSCAGIVVRGGATLELNNCTIAAASAAVNLCEAGCELRAHSSTFRNVRSAVLCERGGTVVVDACRFEGLTGSDVGLRLSADTVGEVRGNSVTRAGALWGRLAPPTGVVFIDAAAADDDELAVVEAEMGGMLLQPP